MSYRVFLGAPTASDISNDPNSYKWQTFSSRQVTATSRLSTEQSIIATSQGPKLGRTQSVVLPVATLEAASRRISLVYKNVLFDDGSEDDEEPPFVEGSRVDGEQTTLISWPATVDESRVRLSRTAPSFLLDISKSRAGHTQFETQETQETQSFDHTYSDASSIAHFPAFHFSLHALTPIASLTRSSPRGTRKVTVLLAALEVEGPDMVRLKKGAEAGKEVAVMSMVLGDEEGAMCKLTAWREVAEAWGDMGIKRGDVLLLESVMATWEVKTSPSLLASPNHKSKAEICYRTMPYTHEDTRLRPDLRLGESDAAVRKVAAIVRWFEEMAGLNVRA
ncbi:hypothetical protein H0H81_011662 [Sphagnurus paluster]|uniref:Shieldin complex subunit 2 first OB fold domain-containing protein n=1 Tax=Sphagnurus paluster TaxID=117069 RepID=A0A9P7K3W2_9AGAR|nr:hypothetical protein H0H81_011662 [Sphagnurus paluster]